MPKKLKIRINLPVFAVFEVLSGVWAV